MNYKKLCLFNLGKPLDKRVHATTIENRKFCAAMRGRSIALQTIIRCEVDTLLAARAAQPNYQE